jgi:hypothetical protein
MAAWAFLAAATLIALDRAAALAQAQSAPATAPAPFIQPLPEPVAPTTRPGDAPFIQPLPEPAIPPVAAPPTTKPAGPFIKPTTAPTTEPATRPAVAPTSGPAHSTSSGPASQPATAPKVDEPKTIGFSAWVAVEQGSRCVDLAKMPADVRELWQKHCTTRGRVLAERAAMDDATAQLAERAGDLAVGPDLTVRKFLADTDKPDARAELFLHGAAVRAVRYRADSLVAEVEMDIRPRTLLASLKGWARSHVNGQRDGLTQLENALLQADDTPLRQTGRGTAPTAEILSPTPDLLEATRAATQPAGRPATATTAPATSQPTTQPTTRAAVPAL